MGGMISFEYGGGVVNEKLYNVHQLILVQQKSFFSFSKIVSFFNWKINGGLLWNDG